MKCGWFSTCAKKDYGWVTRYRPKNIVYTAQEFYLEPVQYTTSYNVRLKPSDYLTPAELVHNEKVLKDKETFLASGTANQNIATPDYESVINKES